MKTRNIRILIVGGGNVAREKLFFLLKSSPDANVHIVAPEVNKEIFNMAETNGSTHIFIKSYDSSDLTGVNIVIAATGNVQLNSLIYLEAHERNILVNVADTPDLCDFYLGSIVTKGDLKIAISTNGKSPTFAKRLREMLEESLPDDIPALLNNLNRFRNTLKGSFQSKVEVLNRLTQLLIR